MDHADEVTRSFLDHGKLPEAGPVDRPGGRNDLPHGRDRGFGDGFGWLPVDEEDITEPDHVLAVTTFSTTRAVSPETVTLAAPISVASSERSARGMIPPRSAAAAKPTIRNG